jgi:hypothetical protein
MEIEAWLKKLGLECYAASFAANDIDTETLPQLTANDLSDLGIVSVGHRRKILNAIQQLDKGVAPVARGIGRSVSRSKEQQHRTPCLNNLLLQITWPMPGPSSRRWIEDRLLASVSLGEALRL